MGDIFKVFGYTMLGFVCAGLVFGWIGSSTESYLLHTGKVTSEEAKFIAIFLAFAGLAIMFIVVGFIWNFFGG